MKKYVNPISKIIEVNYLNMIATSFTTSEEPKDNIVAGARQQKGEWGNLWK